MRRSEVRAVGAEWGEGSGGMFTSVLLGHGFKDGMEGVRLFSLRGMGEDFRKREKGLKLDILGRAKGLHFPLLSRLVSYLSESK